MKDKRVWIIAGIMVLAMILIAVVVKVVNSDDKKDDGYDTYEISGASDFKMSGKASPTVIKTYNNNSSLGQFISTPVNDGQQVSQGTQLVNYDVSTGQRQSLVSKVNAAQQSVNDVSQAVNANPNDQEAQQKLTESRNALTQAQQGLASYDRQINESIYASFDGIVDIKNNKSVGDGQTILQLVSAEPQIKTTVSEYDLDKVNEGDKVNITVSSTGKKATGEIAKIDVLPTSYESNHGDAAVAAHAGSGDESGEAPLQTSNPTEDNPETGSGTGPSKYTVYIRALSSPVRAGNSIEVSVPQAEIKIPKSVLTKQNEVFVLKDGDKVERRKIKVERQNDLIIVKSGLKKGDKVIKHPAKDLNDGDKVEVAS